MMSNEFYIKLNNQSPIAYSYLELMLDRERGSFDCLFLDINQTFEKLFKLKAIDIIGKRLSEIQRISQDITFEIVDILEDVFKNKDKSISHYTKIIDRYYKIFSHIIEENKIVLLFSDITENDMELEALRKKYKLYESIKNYLKDTVWVYNVSRNKFTYANQRIREILGYTPDEMMDIKIEQIFMPDYLKIINDAISNSVAQIKAYPTKKIHNMRNLQLVTKNGNLVWVEMNSIYRFNDDNEIEIVSVLRDVDISFKKEEEIVHISTHDPLTGLKNRSALRIKKKYLEENKALLGNISVMSIDIDNFAVVNDVFGNHAGDQMIIDFSNKITSSIGKIGEVYHIGSDEFIVLFNSTDLSMIQGIGKKILQNISSQIIIHNRTYLLTASIGISVGDVDGGIEQVFKNADTAMYIAKKTKNTIKIFTQEMEKARTRDTIIEDDLRSAIESEQFEIHYQPIYDVKKGSIHQAEALLRWNHPEFGRISPGEFIPIAEKTKLILPITDWVIGQACKKIAEWNSMGINIIVSVNLSFISFENRSDKLTEFIINTIKETGIKPSSLKLEITESAIMSDIDEVLRVFKDLKKFGVILALDDFGTGYSSFSYLKNLPLNIIKLDRSLVSNVVSDEKEQMIVESLVTIIHGLGLEVIVEGVETQEQLEYLKNLACDYIQGYLFSPPLPPDEFLKYYNSMKKE